MAILLTGGAGFIGHHLTQHLLSAGEEVVVVDNLSTSSVANLKFFESNKAFKFICGDVRDAQLMEPFIEKASIIYNLAASVGVQKIFKDPIECIENNTQIGSTILRLAAKYQKRTFMFSTSEIYGKTEVFPFSESSNITLGAYDKLRWSYACSKVLDDYLARAYFEKRGLPVTIVRLFNAIGARQVGAYGMVVPRFMNQALNNEPLSIFGTGEQTRSFTDVRDVVRALYDLASNDRSLGELINLGTDNEISVLELAKAVLALTGSKSGIVFKTYEEAYGPGFEDMDRRVACADKLSRISGFKFRYQLAETLSWIHQELLEDRRSHHRQAEMPVA